MTPTRLKLSSSGGMLAGLLLVTCWAAFQDDRLGLEVVPQALYAAFASDAGLLEATERDPEIGPEGVVANGA